MKMRKRTFRIGELAKHLNVERFVIRFWEKEFNIKGTRSLGGQRFYEDNDIELFQQIKKLLYEDGFTIAGAKKILSKKNPTSPEKPIVASQKTTMNVNAVLQENKTLVKKNKELAEQIVLLQEHLLKLRELL